MITEYFVNFESAGGRSAESAVRSQDSYIALPTAPGLGIELDEAALARYPLRERRERHIRQYSEE